MVMRTMTDQLPDHEILIRLNLEPVLGRLEQARRSANAWNIVTVAFGGLLWLWLQAPSFNLLPAAIRAFLVVIGVLGYGVLGFANSPVINSADYVNLGYGVLVGPTVLLFIALGWINAERRLLGTRLAVMDHPALASTSPSWRSPPMRNTIAFGLAALVLIGSSLAALNQFFSFHAHQADLRCDREALCRPHENYWVTPWTNSDKYKLSWLRTSVEGDWCVFAAPGWPPGFRAVLKDAYFTRQVERLPKFECTGGDRPQPRSATPQVAEGPDTVRGRLRAMFFAALSADPYTNFPYVYPLINLPVLLLSFIGQAFVLFKIARLRRYCARLPRVRLRWNSRS